MADFDQESGETIKNWAETITKWPNSIKNSAQTIKNSLNSIKNSPKSIGKLPLVDQEDVEAKRFENYRKQRDLHIMKEVQMANIVSFIL
ncbi:hypothetical protein [Virgibacillus sp. MG-45]|uniref:hypothetical protein n=1 Tax=Virgibacillus sp. MG-45 TaxID=3102791 RepID=UPI002ED878DA